MLDDPENGKWDGQFPVAGLLSQLPENWPSIIERDGFVDVVTTIEGLSIPESAVLRRIAFRTGPASQGCWESLGSMARYLGGNERTIRRAINRLLDLGLIHKVQTGKFRGRGDTNAYIPILRAGHRYGLPVHNDTGHRAHDGVNGVPVVDFQSANMDTESNKQKGTDIVSDIQSIDSGIQEYQDAGGLIPSSKFVLTDTESKTGSASAVNVPECVGGCGQPWTRPEKHLEKLLFNRKCNLPAPEYLCQCCWQAQVRAAAPAGIEA